MDVLVAIKRVPNTGARLRLTADQQGIDATNLGFTISPHEECAVEEAIRIAEATGGTSTVLSLGPPEVAEQLKNALAMGITDAVALVAAGSDWGPEATAEAIAEAIGALDRSFDLLLFGNESADNGNYQVAIRVAALLGLPVAVGIKGIDTSTPGTALARREAEGGWDVFELPLPAVVAVREGINLPRHASVRGRLRSAKAPIATTEVSGRSEGLAKERLTLPPEESTPTEILGEGPAAAPRVVEVLRELGVVA